MSAFNLEKQFSQIKAYCVWRRGQTRNGIKRRIVSRRGKSARVTLAIFQHNCAPGINRRRRKGGKEGQVLPGANEVQHENASSAAVVRADSPSPLSSGGTGIIKPNVNCVIVPSCRASARLGSARLASVARETAAIERSAVHQRAFHFFSFSPRAVAVPHDVIVPSADPRRAWRAPFNLTNTW